MSASRLEMRILRNALARAFADDRGVGRRVLVVGLGEEAVEREVPGFLAARILFAEVAADAAHAANLRDFRPLERVVAQDMDRGGGGHQFDQLLGTDRDALAATDAQALIDLREAILDANRMLGADVRARAIAEAAKAAALVATGGGGGGCAVADAVVVANADRLRTRAATLDDGDASRGGRGGNAENLRNFRGAGFPACRTGAVGGRACHEGARVAVAPRKAAATAIGARQGGRDETDARVFLHGEILVRNRERESRNRAHGGDDESGNKNGVHGGSGEV